MGTNYYLQRKVPTLHETIHIGKRSFGWAMHWDSCDESAWPRWCDEDHSFTFGPDGRGAEPTLPHDIHSVEDIRAYLRTGEWQLIDEYGEGFEDPLVEIDELCSWDGELKEWSDNHPDNPVWRLHTPNGYRDSEGQIFDRGDGFI